MKTKYGAIAGILACLGGGSVVSAAEYSRPLAYARSFADGTPRLPGRALEARAAEICRSQLELECVPGSTGSGFIPGFGTSDLFRCPFDSSGGGHRLGEASLADFTVASLRNAEDFCTYGGVTEAAPPRDLICAGQILDRFPVVGALFDFYVVECTGTCVTTCSDEVPACEFSTLALCNASCRLGWGDCAQCVQQNSGCFTCTKNTHCGDPVQPPRGPENTPPAPPLPPEPPAVPPRECVENAPCWCQCPGFEPWIERTVCDPTTGEGQCPCACVSEGPGRPQPTGGGGCAIAAGEACPPDCPSCTTRNSY